MESPPPPNGLCFIIALNYTGVEIYPYLARGSPFKLASVSLEHTTVMRVSFLVLSYFLA